MVIPVQWTCVWHSVGYRQCGIQIVVHAYVVSRLRAISTDTHIILTATCLRRLGPIGAYIFVQRQDYVQVLKDLRVHMANGQ